MDARPLSEPMRSISQQQGYRGRVRTGCLTCRSRKVRCDEGKPVCRNCTKVKRDCVYKPWIRKNARNSKPVEDLQSPSNSPASNADIIQSPSTLSVSEQTSLSLLESPTNVSWGTVRDPFLYPDSSIVDVTARLENALRRQNQMAGTDGDTEAETAPPSALISRDIELTTTMDILAVKEAPLQPSFSFFVDAVDCPAITPFDDVNWQGMKLDVVELGMSNSAVASAIMAVSVLYKGQIYGIPLSKALSLYRSARSACEELLNDDEVQSFNNTLVASFLLCLFEFVHYDMVPFLKEPNELYIKRLEAWKKQPQSHSDLALRIIAWLRLLYATTIRGGGMGIMSDQIFDLLPTSKGTAIPSLQMPSDHYISTSSLSTATHLYSMFSTPIFDFYLQLQTISAEIAKLTHYHRSRTTGTDQDEVIVSMSHIKSRLHSLWDTRSPLQHQTPEDIRANFAPKIAEPIIALAGVCAAAYHAEFVEIERVLGDPVSESTDSKRAMACIRDLVDGDWNAYSPSYSPSSPGNEDQGTLRMREANLNPGYLRPLFLCAIECMDHDMNDWAVKRLKHIRNPICRSDFFAAFGKALSDAQLRKERRVTSKYFCIWYFGVRPPFI